MPFLDLKQALSGKLGGDGGPRRPARIPKKYAINFAQVGVRRVSWTTAAPAVALILLAAVVFGKFMVYDRLADVAAAQREALAVQQELDACSARIEAYGQLNDVYAHYTYSGMTEEEQARVDRVQVMSLLERVVFPRTPVSQWDLTGNRLTLNIEGQTLQEINLTAQALLGDDLVGYCEVNTATTDPDGTKYGAVRADPDKVSANIVVYLVKPEVTES